MFSPRSDFAVRLVAFRPQDAFIDLIAKSISGATILSIAIKIRFWILSSTAFKILPISPSILSLNHLYQDFTFKIFSAKLLPGLSTVNSWSPVFSLTVAFSSLSHTVLQILKSWSKSSNWLRRLLFDYFFLQMETSVVLADQLHLKYQQ